MRPVQCCTKRTGRSLDPLRDCCGDAARVCSHSLVAHLDRRRGRTGCCDVASPHPRGATRIACTLELGPALRLYPETRVRAVREPGVVGARLLAFQPGLLEERARDVAAVP